MLNGHISLANEGWEPMHKRFSSSPCGWWPWDIFQHGFSDVPTRSNNKLDTAMAKSVTHPCISSPSFLVLLPVSHTSDPEDHISKYTTCLQASILVFTFLGIPAHGILQASQVESTHSSLKLPYCSTAPYFVPVIPSSSNASSLPAILLGELPLILQDASKES